MSEHDYGDDAGAGFEIRPTPRDYANLLLAPLNLDLQLVAVRSLLKRNRDEYAGLQARLIKIKARTAGPFDDGYGEAFYEAVYQDGTHAQAAIGMIAPLWESILVRLLEDLLVMGVRKTPAHVRWTVPDTEQKKWNCKFYWDQKQDHFRDDIMSGIRQISKMVEIGSALHADDLTRIEALFTYRNYMLHNGIEWPAERLTKFAESTAKWPKNWFSSARRDNAPWIYYMTQLFIDDCLAMLERFVDEIGSLFMNWNAGTGGSLELLRARETDRVTL